MVLFKSALVPMAVLCSPEVLSKSAAVPTAVFASALLNKSVPAPRAVLKPPLVSLKSEYQPTAVLPAPAVRFLRALVPSAVVKLGYPPSGGGTTACTLWQMAKEPSVKIISSAATNLNWIDDFRSFI